MVRRTFEFSAGSLALDFVDTVANRAGDSLDLLGLPEAIETWLKAAGVEPEAALQVPDDGLERARALREAIYRSAAAAVAGEKPDADDLALINGLAAGPDLRPQLSGGRVVYRSQRGFEAALSFIAAEAVHCLSDGSAERLRRCPDCKMIFKDNSRGRRRIWCSSQSGCGNRAKVRRHRAAKREGAER